MKCGACMIVLLWWMVASSFSAEFAVYEVRIDPGGEPLAAYQVKISDRKKSIKILSVEGGEHPAFRKAPFFDPKAIQRNVIKLAGIRVDGTAALPESRTRVAALHVEISGETAPEFEVVVEAAARPGGQPLQVKATISRRNQE